MKKYWWILIVILVLGTCGYGYYSYTQKQKATQNIETTVAKKQDLRVSFSVDGAMIAETYEPKFTIAGRVSRVLVKEGDSVKQGQWLATLDATEAQKNLEKVLRDYSKERNDFEQDIQVTYLDNDVTDTIKRILEKNQWDLEKSVLDVELKDLALRESRLVSPIAGVVANLTIKAGDVVSTQNQTEVVTIAKPGDLVFEGSGEEGDILKINDEQTIEITLDTYPKESFPAKLIFVSPIALRDSSGIASYPIKAVITDTKDNKIIDGMEGSVNFITKEVKGALTILNSAVYREGSQAYVDVVENGVSKKTPITTGFTNGREVEVKTGLDSGAIVNIHK